MINIRRKLLFFCVAAWPLTSGCKSVQQSKSSADAADGTASQKKNPSGDDSFEASLTSITPAGKWGPLMAWPAQAIHMGLTPAGKVIFWDRDSANDNPGTKYDSLGVYIWNPADGTFQNRPLGFTNLFCAGGTWASGGLLYVAGGHIQDGTGQAGVTIFNSQTEEWSKGPQMNAGRWYPTTVPLGTGEILILSGASKSGADNTMPQVVNPKANALRNLPNSNFGYPLWPQAFQLTSGLVVTVGPDPVARYIDPSPAKTAAKIRQIATAPYKKWRIEGSAVMYDKDKILTVGGFDPVDFKSTNAAMDFQIGSTPGNISWKLVPGMTYPRGHHVATVLPTGEVVVVGGSTLGLAPKSPSELVYPAEIWSPTNKKFTTMAPMSAPRIYHSTAILLPDGSVLSAGSDPLVGGHTAQIFYPPYLFAGDRPAIVSAPKTLVYNQSFNVGVTGKISQVSLMRAGMVTHSFDHSQRRMTLPFTQVGGTLAVKAPLNGNYAPPGHYMLFVIGDKGVPSVAAMVNL